ncbi:MAG: SAM-dependent methyltransferase [Desulfobacterales bacterium]|nr:SAM-dependent methyltransferase [Desulfobacterales bacterium]MCP4160590.1 SAM-dependent methyltransferase [Deltaproteobacteria bacterium]
MLSNKAIKRYKHLKKKFKKQNIDVFRLYDWDIPEIRAAVDWYKGHIVIAEYMRKQSDPIWLPIMAKALSEKFGIDESLVHMKERRVGFLDGKRYEKLDDSDEKLVVSERDLKFKVNLNDYVDTGLFSDHRDTRQMVRELVKDKDFLNLYCYTGSFTCYAAKGGAKSTVSVDRSLTAISWVKENLELNQIPEDNHTLYRVPTYEFLDKAKKKGQKFDIAVVDPPSFSTSKDSRDGFDISKDHAELLLKVIALMRKGGLIFFSTNHQDFDPRMSTLRVKDFDEITSKTIPEDYINKRKKIHRCWKIQV